MIIVKSKFRLLHEIKNYQKNNQSIALIPTMGNLHKGHIKLIKEAQKKADIIIVSIFINKMQFNCIDDYKSYPNTPIMDCTLLKKHKVDLVFLPKIFDIYKSNMKFQTFIEVPFFSFILEGSIRTGHFRGVTTIVAKLFNLIKPNFAFFGKKDFQQLFIIKKMVKDLNYDIKIISVSTIREKDGLALSSRNNNLTIKERILAPKLNQIMNCMSNFLIKKLNINDIIKYAETNLKKNGFNPDGIFICDAKNLQPIKNNSSKVVILIAAWLGKTRLVDSKLVYINNILEKKTI